MQHRSKHLPGGDGVPSQACLIDKSALSVSALVAAMSLVPTDSARRCAYRKDQRSNGHYQSPVAPPSQAAHQPQMREDIQAQKAESRKSNVSMAGRKRLQCVPDGPSVVSGADFDRVVDAMEAKALIADARFADGQKVRSETTDPLLQEDLDAAPSHHRISQPQDCRCEIDEFARVQLHEQKAGDRNGGTECTSQS